MQEESSTICFYSQSISFLAELYNVNPDKGLSDEQVLINRQKYGNNEIEESPRRHLFLRFLDQFNDKLAFILLAAAVISFFLALFDEDFTQLSWSSVWSFVEPVVILLILIANAIVGLVQESNADSAIKALKTYSPLECKVLRNGELTRISACELVPGDIVKLSIGDRIPADCRIVTITSACGLKIDQSLLTGESCSVTKSSEVIEDVSSTKKILLQDQKNILFSGTLVTLGHCLSMVIAIGNASEMGVIAKSIMNNGLNDADDESSPLKQRLNAFGDDLAKAISILCIIVWLINIPHFSDKSFGQSWMRGALYYFKIAVALAVAAIPEGLSVIITTCLALGTRRMAQQKAIVRSLSSVETIGCTTLICSDKTGTLTTNSMSARMVITNSSKNLITETFVTGTTYNPIDGGIFISKENEIIFKELQQSLSRCTEASLNNITDDKKVMAIGEPTEVSLVTLSKKISTALSINDNSKSINQKLIATLDFDRCRKSSSILWEVNDEYVLYVKGAPEHILSRTSKMMLEDGSIKMINDSDRDFLLKKTFSLANKEALRILAIAKKNYSNSLPNNLNDPKQFKEIESDLTFLGLVGIEDPARPEAAGAIRECHYAGIRVIMITGDCKATAESLARKVGLLPSQIDYSDEDEDEDEEIISFTGNDIDTMSDEQLINVCKSAKIFSRTDPSHKLRLVEVFRRSGHVVAMTGDGVNDAPALKKAHIGIAMGSGSDVAKEAADLILADGNFATITKAIAEGRSIYDNTLQFIRYLISSNIGEVASLLLGTLLGIPEVLAPVQLLWVNLVTDGLPATALSFNPPDPYRMFRPPRPSTAPLVDKWRFFRYLFIGTYVGIATILGYIIGLSSGKNPLIPSTMALSVLVVIEMLNALNSISETESLLSVYPWTNFWLIGAIGLSLFLHFAILHVQVLSLVFKVCPLSFIHWIQVLALSFPVIILDEILKAITRKIYAKGVDGTETVPLLSK